MEDSPDMAPELEERRRYRDQLPPQLIISPKEIIAFCDNKLVQDDRVFPTMLQMEKLCVGYVNNYFRTVQDDVTPDMKRDVAVWMFEICDEERMHTAVFIRAVQYMDKYLSMQRISRTQLQLLGAVCLLISSKMAGTVIPAKTLVMYTANSITSEMLLDWERMLLGTLQWDMNGIVSSDFVQHILNLLPQEWWDSPEIYERIKTFISYCAVDYQLGVYLPSTVASASVVAALTPFLNADVMNKVLCTIQSATDIDLSQLQQCMDKITSKVKLSANGIGRNVDAICGSNLEAEQAGSMPATTPSTAGCGIKAR